MKGSMLMLFGSAEGRLASDDGLAEELLDQFASRGDMGGGRT
jgi:hypothetical protein